MAVSLTSGYLNRAGHEDPVAAMETGLPYKNKQRQRAYQRAWYARRKAEWFAGKVCAECGSGESLELDHIDPSEKATHRVWCWGQVRRETELAKCQPLCKGCHKLKSSRQHHMKLKLTTDLRPLVVCEMQL